MRLLNKIGISLIMGLFITTIVSCEKETLDKRPLDRFSEDDVWEDVNLAQQFLNTVYNGIGQFGVNHSHDPNVMGNASADETMQRGDHGVWVLTRGIITSSNYGTYNMWQLDYKSINDCNTFLERVDQLEDVDEDEIKSLKAQTRFIRAINYADLINYYSWWEGEENGVPIITQTFNLNDDFKEKRANYSEVVDFIISELDDITDDLPEAWELANWGRVTKGAVLALKSEILLYAASERHNPNEDLQKWQAASDAAKAVIDLNLYELSPVEDWQDYANIFLDPGNKEIILGRAYDPTNLSANWVDLLNSPNGYGGWTGNCPTQQMVDRFQMDNGKDISDPTSGYEEQDPYVNRELRFYANIVYNDREYRGRKVESWEGGLDSKDGPTGWNVSPTNYTLYKFMNENIDFQVAPAPTPYIIFRLAEIYLNYAESEYHLGHEDVARNYINQIRQRAKLPNISSGGDQLLNDIRHERGIELAFERDFRWNDVRRWEILDQTSSQDFIGIQIDKNADGSFTYTRRVAQKREYHERLYSLPIPIEERQKAPELKQNPGYND